MSDTEICDKCGFKIDTNEEFRIINGSEVTDYCDKQCLGEALADFLTSNEQLHLDKVDMRTYAF